MKLKTLLVSAVALLCSAASWADYTEYMTVGNGWTKITSSEQFKALTLSDYYFALVAAEDGKDLIVTTRSYGNSTNYLEYLPAKDPRFDTNRLFMLASYSSGYSMQVASLPTRYFQSASGSAYDFIIQTGFTSATSFFTLNFTEGKITIQNQYSHDGGNYFGPWNNTVTAGDRIAGNKGEGAKGYFYLYAIPRSYQQDIIRATIGGIEKDVSFLLPDAKVELTQDFSPWNGIHPMGGNDAIGFCPEYYDNNGFTMDAYQTISVPNGKYKVTVNGFYRYGASYDATDKDPKLYANSDNAYLPSISKEADNRPTNHQQAAVALNSNRYLSDAVQTTVTNGSLTIEIKKTGTKAQEWMAFDNFTLTLLDLCVSSVAIELTDGNMEANTWYYKDVTTTGIHAFSATNLENIVYTTNANDLTGEVSATLPQNFLNSSSTRYYFKSSSDQTLTISKICDNFSYWFLRTSDYKYLSRGGQYNAQTVADEYGLPVRIAFENNYVNFIFVDNWRYLFDAADGKLFEDTDATTYVNFAIQPTDGGYYIINKNDRGTLNQKLYIYTNDGNRVKMSSENATVWVLESVSGDTHKTRMQTIKDAQATLAATSAGVTWTDTQDELDAYLSNVTFENKTITTSGQKEAYQKDAANNGPWTVFSETVSGLSDGLYKVSVKAFERIASNDDTYDKAAGNAGLAYLYANDQKVQLCSVFDYPSDVAYTDNGENPSENVTKGGKYYPNSMYGAQQAFDADKYINEVFVWVTGGSVEFGIRIPQSYQNNTNDNTRQNWICCNDYSLTYYGDARINISEESSSAPSVCDNANVRLTRTLTGGQWNGFSLPFSLSAKQLEASSLNGATIKQWASVSENVITLEDATEIVAGDPYLIKPTANDNANIVNPTFNNVTVTNPTEAVKGEGSYTLQAHLYATDLATDGSVAYVSTTDSSIKKLTSGGINGLRAIFNIPTASGVKALTVNFGDDTTEILSIDAEGNITESGAIYNLAGQRLSKAQKGVNIINGKKVLIK